MVSTAKKFKLCVVVHQNYVLSQLLFIHVFEAISERFNQRKSVPFELRYADDLSIIADTLDESIATHEE